MAQRASHFKSQLSQHPPMVRRDRATVFPRVLAGAALSVLMAACTPGLKDRDIASGLSVPNQYTSVVAGAPATDADDAQAAGPNTLTTGWLATFADPRLDEISAIALERNPDLMITAARFAQARARAKISRADRMPTLNATFDSNRFQTRFTGPTGEVGVVRQSQFNLTGTVSWELDLWGRLAATNAAANRDFIASQADLAAAELSLIANISRTYFDLIAASQQTALAQETVDSFDRSLTIVKSRYDRGITNALDVRLAASSLEGARAQYVLRQSQEQRSRRALEVLLAQYPAGEIEVPAQLPDMDGSVAPGMPSALLERRPDVQAAYLRLEAADYRVAAAKRELLPAFSLNGSAGNRNEQFSEFMDFDNLVWQIASNITQPIFRGGRIRQNIKLVNAQADEALATYAQAVLTAFQEVENTLADEDLLAEQVKFQQEAAIEAAAAARLAQQQYSRGLTPILNLLDSQRQDLNSRVQLIDLRRQRVQNRVNLYLALGGPVLGAAEEQTASNALTAMDPDVAAAQLTVLPTTSGKTLTHNTAKQQTSQVARTQTVQLGEG